LRWWLDKGGGRRLGRHLSEGLLCLGLRLVQFDELRVNFIIKDLSIID
jgi:hypothetical protein